ncbi:uncharacterized protein LOC122264600 [Penaeus japonicus]|uniref:uncharacterized protein LOC122264600 n=1 Tax=Penaeus japonicus TaxID=27405 RepID=UPI001C714140|nr:uncharacterized protein LOC122264600 [Penaeus japonicus]
MKQESEELGTEEVSGVLNNTGHSVVFTVDEDTEEPGVPGAQGTLTGSMGVPLGGPMGGGMGGTMGGSLGHGLGSQMGVSEEENMFPHPNRRHRNAPLNITGGPLSYRYRVGQVQLHFGSKDHLGSEHTVNSTSFPAEIQIYGYNSQLFSNFSDAVSRAHGIVAICIMIQGYPRSSDVRQGLSKG